MLRDRHARVLALLGASALSPFFAEAALAQAPETNTTGLEEIVVTAQKRAENVQSVPISISAVSETELSNRSVKQISDLASVTPNVTFASTAQGVQSSAVAIRGLSSGSVELVNEQPTAIYIDDVYQSSALGSMAFMGPDLERVEILRGPQGTLFGRNTIGGAVKIHTKQPDLAAFGGRIMAGAGNHGIVEGQGMLNVPIVADTAAARVNFGFRDDNGFIRERTYGQRLGRNKMVFARGQLLIEPSDRLRVLFSGDYVRATSEGTMNQPVFLNPLVYPVPAVQTNLPSSAFTLGYRELSRYYGFGTPTDLSNFNAIQARFFECGGGPVPTLTPRCLSSMLTNPATTTGLFSDAQRWNQPSVYRDWGVAGTISYELSSDIEVKSITAYRDFDNFTYKDYDATPAILISAVQHPSGNTFTQELQLNGRLLNDRLKFALGMFYYDFHGTERGTSTSAPLAASNPNTVTSFLLDHVRQKSLGFYGQATFALTDRLNITGGLRNSAEDKSIRVSQYSSAAAPTVATCTVPVPNAQCVNTADLHYNSWDWTAGVDYKPTQDVMIYARAAKGFKAGGINQRSTTNVPFTKYQPMTAINYELGIKADLLDRRVRVNLSAFQTDIKGFQRSIRSTFLNSAGNPVSVVGVINATTARIRGVEAEVTIAPVEGLRISGQVGYTDPKWGTFLAVDSRIPSTDPRFGTKTLDLSKTDFQSISKWTFGISPSYTVPTSFGEIHFQLDYYWRSSQNISPSSAYPTDMDLPIPALIQPGYGLLNGRIAVRIEKATEIAFWAKNLTDKRYFSGGINNAASTGFAMAQVGDPRTFGVQVSHSF